MCASPLVFCRSVQALLVAGLPVVVSGGVWQALMPSPPVFVAVVVCHVLLVCLSI